ncbi:uncharacterized protein LOC111692747 [Anoplophora glabripennis]|uniref:uncharacterized protein LOC111692747 n=1 Tax=Anoplophora glabripennis TaxID=217634 RepID=UPI000C7754AD|nr:uncharacterized protein LOC111692747 [Anoplophora glabripennis]
MADNSKNVLSLKHRDSDDKLTDDEWVPSFDRRVAENCIANRASQAVQEIIILSDTVSSDRTIRQEISSLQTSIVEGPLAASPQKKRAGSPILASSSTSVVRSSDEGPSAASPPKKRVTTPILASSSTSVERSIDEGTSPQFPKSRVEILASSSTSMGRPVDDEGPTFRPTITSTPRQNCIEILASSSTSMGRPVDDEGPTFRPTITSTPRRNDGLDDVVESIRAKAALQHIQLEEFKNIWYGDFKQYVRRKEAEFINEVRFRRQTTIQNLEKINEYRKVLDEIAEELTVDINNMNATMAYMDGFAEGLPEKMFNLPNAPRPRPPSD